MAETGHQSPETRTLPVAGQPAEAQTIHRPTISVELVIQQFAMAQPAPAQGEAPSPGERESRAGHGAQVEPGEWAGHGEQVADRERTGQGVQAARLRAGRYELFRSVHRVPAGTTIRQLLCLACPAPGAEAQSHGHGQPDGHERLDRHEQRNGQEQRDGHGQPTGADLLISDIENRARGLSRHGRRAWLDDLLADTDRVEVMLPIVADARKARFERVAKNRARKWRMS